MKCLICWTRTGSIIILPCHSTHSFHVECITKWARNCPLCQSELPTSLLKPRSLQDLVLSGTLSGLFYAVYLPYVWELLGLFEIACRNSHNLFGGYLALLFTQESMLQTMIGRVLIMLALHCQLEFILQICIVGLWYQVLRKIHEYQTSLRNPMLHRFGDYPLAEVVIATLAFVPCFWITTRLLDQRAAFERLCEIS